MSTKPNSISSPRATSKKLTPSPKPSANRSPRLCPCGIHRASLIAVKISERMTGLWVVLDYRTVDPTFTLHVQYLVRPARPDLEVMCLDHLELLLQAVQATLGVDAVPHLGSALKQMVGKPVRIGVSHRLDRRLVQRAEITGWEAAE